MVEVISLNTQVVSGRPHFDVEIMSNRYGVIRLYYEFDGQRLVLIEDEKNIDGINLFMETNDFNLAFEDADLAIPGIDAVRNMCLSRC
ncbi:hypothetical protein E4187_22220 (plasmid) [Aeromonas media]|uniref:hypothetical protein n=1 Tax=Aeromonas media TaxID=651 RepID=UPI00148AF0A7|nr:hypothetical protein [Aeromonas media]QJT37012.1 hypothetical protein E4187_22220 [Aeromonas media]